MKKIISISLILILILITFTACQNQENDMSLSGIIDELYQGADIPASETITLDSSNFEYFAFIPYEEGLSGAASDALVNITPHSLVLIKSKDANGEDLAKEIFENANPNKWLCVSADTTRVFYSDHYVVLIMSFEDIAKDIADNFFNLELKDGEMHEYKG